MSMINLKKSHFVTTSLLTSVFVLSSFTSGFAESNDSNFSQEGKVEKAIYFVDGVTYDIPEEQYSNFFNENGITELPYDPALNPEEENESKLKSNNKNKKGFGTYAYACVAGDEYSATRSSAAFKLGKSGHRVINKTSSNLTQTSKLDSSFTISGKLSITAGVSTAVVKKEIGIDVTVGNTWTTGEATKVTVRPGDWGWIDYGSHYETWKGSYYYLSGTCTKSNIRSLTSEGPKYKAIVAKSAKYPY